MLLAPVVWILTAVIAYFFAAKTWWFPPPINAHGIAYDEQFMTHVVIGLIYLGVICQAVMRGKFKAEDVEVAGLYWHFVDLVWMFVFPLVYLMSAKI